MRYTPMLLPSFVLALGSMSVACNRGRTGDVHSTSGAIKEETPGLAADAVVPELTTLFEVRAGKDEALRVPRYRAFQPSRGWGGAYEHEEAVCANPLGLTGLAVLDGEPLEVPFAFGARHRAVGADLDVGEPADTNRSYFRLSLSPC